MSQQPATSGLEFFETLEKSDGWFGLVFRASGKYGQKMISGR